MQKSVLQLLLNRLLSRMEPILIHILMMINTNFIFLYMKATRLNEER